MIGLDTGYFIRLLQGHEEAKGIWSRLLEGEDATVSCLTLFELARLAKKGAIEVDAEKALREGINVVCHLSWLDSEDALLAGASLSHGLGIPSIDALILAALLSSGATLIYTTDSHFEAYKNKAVRIVRI